MALKSGNQGWADRVTQFSVAGQKGVGAQSRPIGEEMSRATSTAVVFLIVVFLLLAGVYPIWTEAALGRHPFSHWLKVYFQMAVLVTCVALGVSLLASRLGSLHALGQSVVAALVTVLTLAVYGIIVGRVSAQVHALIPLGDANAKFLGEFMSIKFIFVISPLVALMTAAITFIKWLPPPSR